MDEEKEKMTKDELLLAYAAGNEQYNVFQNKEPPCALSISAPQMDIVWEYHTDRLC